MTYLHIAFRQINKVLVCDEIKVQAQTLNWIQGLEHENDSNGKSFHFY